MGNEERAVIFGRAAGAYDAARPGYPIEAIRHVLGRAEVEVAVEIGAGTGKATTTFAPEVGRIICVEPSAEMAALLEQRGLPGVEVVVSRLEEWEGPGEPVDLVYAAQAWHWVDHSIAYGRAMEMLRPGGLIALIWNVPQDRYEVFEEAYRAHAPEILAEHDARIRRRDTDTWLGELSGAGFEGVELFTHQWSQNLSPVELRALYATYSDHMLVPEPRRSRMLDALEETVRKRGGSITLEYATRVFSGMRRGS
jgi:protein-L-isoaspartate O-methyltransferase